MSNHPHPIGLTRREALQVGYSGLLGLGMVSALQGRVQASSSPSSSATGSKPKSVILVFLTGAASHIDTFDPKPDTPVEIRGEFKAIPTQTPGMLFGETLPLLAARSRKFAVVRTLAHKDNNHTAATHHLITGALQPGVRFDKPLSRDDWPCYAAGVSYLRPPQEGVPAGVTLPTFLGEGPLVWPGQHGGFLGPKHDPWQIKSDPNKADFKVDNLRLAAGMEVDQLDGRRSLLESMNQQQDRLSRSLEGKRLTDMQDKAFSMLTSGKVAKAFELHREPVATRDRYGRHAFGQSLLLARRLVQAGVPIVQANMGHVQNWDSHSNNFRRLRNDLCPPLDRAVSALLDDLEQIGLMKDVMVVVLGEFGRTPKVDAGNAGRDHWAQCFSALFAGGDVQGDRAIGKSDATAAFPSTTPYSPDDVGATVYHALGVDHESEVRDRLDRPVQLNRGQVIRELF